MDRYPHRYKLEHELVIRLWMWIWALFVVGAFALGYWLV